MNLEERILKYYDGFNEDSIDEVKKTFNEFIELLDSGEIRSAKKVNGKWEANAWVKKGILLGFRIGEVIDMTSDGLSFYDKDTYPAKKFTPAS